MVQVNQPGKQDVYKRQMEHMVNRLMPKGGVVRPMAWQMIRATRKE